MKRKLFTVFLLLVFGQVNAQMGLFEKHVAITLGTSIAPPLLNPIFDGKNLHVGYDWSLLPPDAELEVGFLLGKSVIFSFHTGAKGLQNSNFAYIETEDNCYSCYTESYKIRTNSYDAGLDLKLFFEPLVFTQYFLMGGGLSFSNSTVYPSTIVVTHDSGEKTTVTTNSEPGVYNTNIYYASLGFGSTRMLNNVIIIDYGIKSSYYFGRGNYKDQYDPNADINSFNYKSRFSEVIDYVVNGNLQSSYALELYFKLGFCF